MPVYLVIHLPVPPSCLASLLTQLCCWCASGPQLYNHAQTSRRQRPLSSLSFLRTFLENSSSWSFLALSNSTTCEFLSPHTSG